jgi:hypothetical protein
MLSICVYCHASLPQNQTLEHFPLGSRVAFDPRRGRLWVICRACQRWNLAPIEQRWEALEELERLTRDRGRLLSQTEQIALLRVEDLDVVRVGRAGLVEEAWWRYGEELRRRRARHNVVTAAEWAARIGLMAVASFGMFWFTGGHPINDLMRWRKFGSTAWRGKRTCRRCGSLLDEVSFKRARYLIVSPTQSDDLQVELRCRACGLRNADGGFEFRDADAERMLRRVLAYHNFAGASQERVREAVRTIDQAGSPHALIHRLGRQGYQIHKGSAMNAVALEIAVNDEVERQQLELELAELEARWREEEELAAIVDGELTEIPLLERIRLKLPG